MAGQHHHNHHRHSRDRQRDGPHHHHSMWTSFIETLVQTTTDISIRYRNVGAPLSSWKYTILSLSIASLIPLAYLYRYRRSIQRHLQQLEQELSKPLMVRATANKIDNNPQHPNNNKIQLLELNPEFVEKYKHEWQLSSLGTYMSSLRFAVSNIILPSTATAKNQEDDNDTSTSSLSVTTTAPRVVQRELEMVLETIVLKYLGHSVGAALLPLFGFSNTIQSTTTQMASQILQWWASHFIVVQQQHYKDNNNDNRNNTKNSNVAQEEGEQQQGPDNQNHSFAIMDKGTLPFSLYDLSAFANLNRRMRNNSNDKNNDNTSTTKTSANKTTPLELLQHGEVGYTPTFTRELIPNPFILGIHWQKALEGMEHMLQKQLEQQQDVSSSSSSTTTKNNVFEPHDASLPTPVPVHERLFPDLYFGWGNAKCTHTKREIIINRLLSVLLNRLSYNYYIMEQEGKKAIISKQKNEVTITTDKGDDDVQANRVSSHEMFIVQITDDSTPTTSSKSTSSSSNRITTAHDFIRALVHAGHEIEVCPRGTITTFGMALCIKEPNDTWTNIPLAYFMKTGYENIQEDDNTDDTYISSLRPAAAAHVGIPHGGMDLSITGPLTGNNCKIQFYMAIEGMCGWHSNHNAKVPWITPTASTMPYSDFEQEQLRTIRMASLLSVCFNAIGTEQDLPYGGYGVLGVCNDTAALLDQAIRGTTQMYPLVSTGAYLMHIATRLGSLRTRLLEAKEKNDNDENNNDNNSTKTTTVSLTEEPMDLMRMAAATMDISSDLHAAPSNVVDGIHRYLACLPKDCSVFQLEQESKKILMNILHQFETYQAKRAQAEEHWNWTNRSWSPRSE